MTLDIGRSEEKTCLHVRIARIVRFSAVALVLAVGGLGSTLLSWLLCEACGRIHDYTVVPWFNLFALPVFLTVFWASVICIGILRTR